MSEPKVFTSGMIAKKPHDRAPEFVKCNLSIKVDEFITFLEAHTKGDGWCNLVIKEGRSGKYYCELDQFTRTEKPGEQHLTANEVAPSDDGSPF